MPVISEAYREQNRLLHESRDDYGRSSAKWCGYIARLANTERHNTILDYGCGKGELKAGLSDFPVVEYDPAIAGKDARPEPADLVVCTDVLEHIEPVHLNAVLRDLARVTKRKLFFAISTTTSMKTLADGRNAHLLVKPAAWWAEKLSQHFKLEVFQDHLALFVGEGVPLCMVRETLPTLGKRRRPLTAEIRMLLDHIRDHTNKYADPFSRIESINMWDDMPDEPDSDMQAAIRVFDSVTDPDAMMLRVLQKARKGIIATVLIDQDRDEAFWRGFFERHLRIADWLIQDGGIVMIGAPMVGVQGIVALGVVDADERWEQIKENVARVSARIETAPAHGRTAVVVCYGPSLKHNVEALKAEAASGKTIVSVSGAHDFLIANGITPALHLECDPRPHKADNIAYPVQGVTYLLGSCCHPALFDKLQGADVRLWHVSAPEHQMRLVDELGEKADCVISGGGSVGLRSIPVLYAMGFRDFKIYAMDCSFSDDGSEQWAGPHAGKRQDLVQVDCAGRVFTSSPVLMTYATGFFETMQKARDCTFTMVGNGLLQSMCQVLATQPQMAA